MLSCPQSQKQIPDFLDDLLSEADRRLLRNHLQDCAPCRKYRFRQGHWAVDLNKINSLELPFDLAGGIREALLHPEDFTEVPAKKKFPKNLTAALLIVPALMLFSWAAGKSWHAAGPEGPAPLQPVSSQVSKNTEVEKAVPQEWVEKEKSSRTRVDINLQPLRWKLKFASPSDLADFVGKIKLKKWNMEFLSDEAVVLSLDRQQLAELVSVVRLNAVIDGKGVFKTAADVPAFSNSVRVTLLPGVTGQAAPRVRTMHLKFSLPNIFVLQARLESEGVKFIYHSNDLWIVEMAAEDYGKFQLLIGENPGMIWNEESSPDMPGAGRIKVLLTLDSA